MTHFKGLGVRMPKDIHFNIPGSDSGLDNYVHLLRSADGKVKEQTTNVCHYDVMFDLINTLAKEMENNENSTPIPPVSLFHSICDAFGCFC
ncbi:hypothetical protein Bhyg_08558 [Pseudolycoriella hygida]|uniref:Uncharacterized protein n=1 Tax=Pseudolycoriella hygida TaxID=35572 RepID=A0A9Q0N506_9DIPT|nr:hypothetical protein Bhyg_08558 [Pseudolycoriella hygida]